MRTVCVVAASFVNEADLLTRYQQGEFSYCIAVDAGFSTLERLGIQPDLALGDFDSLGYVPKAKSVSRHPCVKNKSDLELALDRCVRLRFEHFVIYGALGGRLDHTLVNLQLFALFSEKGFYVTAIGDDFAVRALTGPDVFEIPCTFPGATVSVISMTKVSFGVIERGLSYELSGENLNYRSSRGLSNQIRLFDPISVEAQGNACGGNAARENREFPETSQKNPDAQEAQRPLVGVESGTLLIFYPL